jgi:hypothetical protein
MPNYGLWKGERMWKNECVSIDLFIHVIFCLLINFKKKCKSHNNYVVNTCTSMSGGNVWAFLWM